MGGVQRTGPASRPGGGGMLGAAGCAVAFAAVLAASSLYARELESAARELFGMPRAAGSLVLVLGYLALALVAYFRPSALMRRGARLVAFGATVAAAVLATVAVAVRAPVPVAVSVALFRLVEVWLTFLVGCRLVGLGSLKAAATAVIGGIVLRQLALSVYGLLPLGEAGWTAVMGALCACAAAYLTWRDAPLLSLLAGRASLDVLELTNPLASLRPPGALFACVALVSLTYGFSCAWGIPDFGPLRVTVVLLMLVLLWLLLVRRDGQEDQLFSLAVFFIMAGLLAVPLEPQLGSYAANSLLFVGSNCFGILLWLLIFGIGRRNPVAMVSVFGVVNCLAELGFVAGRGLGGAVLAMADERPGGGLVVALGLALFFFSFVWFAFKRFSFAEAIRGVEPLDRLEVDAGADGRGAGAREGASALEGRLDDLAASAGLTPREAEVFRLLARGRNARFIMDELGVTRNTAKAHIAHIYAKLGVHSHQELLSTVDGPTARGGGAA